MANLCWKLTCEDNFPQFKYCLLSLNVIFCVCLLWVHWKYLIASFPGWFNMIFFFTCFKTRYKNPVQKSFSCWLNMEIHSVQLFIFSCWLNRNLLFPVEIFISCWFKENLNYLKKIQIIENSHDLGCFRIRSAQRFAISTYWLIG